MQKGFTLLEVLIAIFILALMSMMIWQITNNAYRGKNKAEGYDAVYQYSRVAMKRLTDDLTMAYMVAPSLQGKLPDGTISYNTGFIGENGGDADTLNFDSLSNIRLVKDEKKSDQVEVGYMIADCPDTEDRIKCLMRRESYVIDSEVTEGGESFPIAKGITKFGLEYYDPAKQEWRGDWSTKDPVFQNRLPGAVRITLGFQDPRDEKEEILFITSVKLPMSVALIDF